MRVQGRQVRRLAWHVTQPFVLGVAVVAGRAALLLIGRVEIAETPGQRLIEKWDVCFP